MNEAPSAGDSPGNGFASPVLRTARLTLREPRLEDLDAWAEMAGDPELTRYVGGPQPRTQAWRLLVLQAGSWRLHGFGLFSVVETASGRWAGCVGPVRPPDWPGNEIGWRLARWAHGRGYATEAAAAARDWAFSALGWPDVIHPIHPENAASIRVAERLGATRMGPVQMPPPFDALPIVLWGMSRPA
jgi:RimJ/RimL family protein N-acetyltransferase